MPSTWAPSAIPDVKPGILEKGILLRLRFELDQYITCGP
jgi:3-isopropylmalate dehydrogenase